ncbi:MAG: NHLP family bacteriocin export ABC transporter peptidase/permease/ATPase subunit [Treponema sp.]|jgi:NHLM bacteriocin system ABC transporter peptidase/ATP-binding protein|nr:NHLP family bacteriocin export ABC transporter peptidase/permease/ATPase subunit [Treponema sp.]
MKAHKGSKYVTCPQIMQMEWLECGAASLTMVLAYHGKWLPLEQVRKDCGVSRDGSNAKNILRAARTYGLTAKGFRMEPEGLKTLPLPCIIHWNCNHFVVFRGFKGPFALLNDPARGEGIKVTWEEFDKSFTGIALTFEPNQDFVKGGKPPSIWGFVASRMQGMGPPFIFIILTGILTAFLGIVNPVFSRVFIDRILSGISPGWLWGLLQLMLGAALIQFIVSLLQSVYFLKVEGKFAVTANIQFLTQVFKLPMEFFSQRMARDIALRQESNQDVAATLLHILGPQILNLAMLIFYFLVMFRYSLPLTLVGVTAVLINVGIARMVSLKRIAITQVQARDQGKLASATIAGIDMIETLKSSGAENRYFEQWSGHQASVNAASVRFTKLNHLLGELPILFEKLSGLLVLGLGVHFIIRGHFTTGMLLAFQSFLTSFIEPVNSLVEAGQAIQEMTTDMERIEDVMNYPVDIPAVKAVKDKAYHKLSGSLSLKNVTFGYSRLAAPLVENFNLELAAGSRVAFVGASGCGKSTLGKLISGLYTPWSGEITFDGIPLREIPREVITSSLAVVDQDITIFEDTIHNNIKMWDKSIEDFEMILAAKDAQIHEDIVVRENGYNYQLMEGGKDFSGGQKQRMEIARILAQDPTIVILDEATSALDAKTEYDVMEAIKRRDITCIIVAHRLSTIRDCDEIIVLDKGKVVERGTHEDLFKNKRVYTRLIQTE